MNRPIFQHSRFYAKALSAASAVLFTTTLATTACALDHLGDVHGYRNTDNLTVFAFSQSNANDQVDTQVLELVPDINIRAIQKWSTNGLQREDYNFSVINDYHNKNIVFLGGGTAAALFPSEASPQQFRDMATRDSLNELVEYWDGRHNGTLANPAFRDHIFDYVKIQIDGGVDGVFLDEANLGGCQGGPKWQWSGNECFDDYLLADFNRYLLAKYPEYSASDWMNRFGMSAANMIRSDVAADDLEQNFNYREYLAEKGLSEWPHSEDNPLSSEWGRIVSNRMMPIFGGFLEQAFNQYWYDLVTRIRDYARMTQGKEIFITANGIAPFVDFNSLGMYNWNIDDKGAEAAYVPVVDGHLDGAKSLQSVYRDLRNYSQTVSDGAPMVLFIDWPTDMLANYLALPKGERKDFWRIYVAEAYANGLFYALHLKTSIPSDATAKQQGMMSFFSNYAHFYRVNADYYHHVTTLDNPVAVDVANITTSLMAQPALNRVILHLNNHNYTREIEPQSHLTVTLPLAQSPVAVSMVSPDFAGRKLIPFSYRNGQLTLEVDELAFYDVIDIALRASDSPVRCRVGDVQKWNSNISVKSVTLANQSAAPVGGWTSCVTLSAPVALTTSWQTGMYSPSGNSVCFSNAEHNGVMMPGAVATYGFNATVTAGDVEVLGCTAEPLVAKPGEPLDCQYDITKQWDTGFSAEVTVTNRTDQPLQGWQVQYRLGEASEIHNMWNASYRENYDGSYSSENLAWNAVIAAGESKHFGLVASKSVTASPELTFTGGNCMVSGFSYVADTDDDESEETFTLPPREPNVSKTVSWSEAQGDYSLYLPAAPADAELPIVLFLHDYADAAEAESHAIVQALNAIEPVAVFFPQRPETEGSAAWGAADISGRTLGMSEALAQLFQVQQTYKTSSQRIYVYGEGMGADGVYKLLLEFPGVIAGAVAVAGASEVTEPEVMAQTPLWIIHGGADSVNPAITSQHMYEAILNAGGESVTYTEYEGFDHVPAIQKSVSELGLMTWLLGNAR